MSFQYSQPGPPPPPPKPYSQDASRTVTPISSPPPPPTQQQQYRYSQQYPQPPLPPHPPHPSQSPQSPPQSQLHNQSQQPLQFDLPDSLTKHTTPDLSTLLTSPSLLDALVKSHPAYLASVQPLQTQISTNLTLAAQVSSTESQVRALREQTGQLMLQHASLQTQWRRKQTEMDAALAPWGPRAMYQRLTGSIVEQEALVGAVGESFLEGGGLAEEREVNEWVKRVREETTRLEKRREMRARWDEGRVGGWR